MRARSPDRRQPAFRTLTRRLERIGSSARPLFLKCHSRGSLSRSNIA
ncbi:MAG: hypothetical protein ACRECV_07320 [Xanthobacteraceae bacterium]